MACQCGNWLYWDQPSLVTGNAVLGELTFWNAVQAGWSTSRVYPVVLRWKMKADTVQ